MNLADILDAILQAETETVAKPEITVTRVQAPYWTMRGVVTGSRRNWKRGA